MMIQSRLKDNKNNDNQDPYYLNYLLIFIWQNIFKPIYYLSKYT
jgi:hypothetical protein